MDTLAQELFTQASKDREWKPFIFDLNKKRDSAEVKRLLSTHPTLAVVDDYEEQLKELFQINNPTLVYTSEFTSAFKAWSENIAIAAKGLHLHGKWVWYSWSATMVHVLDDEDFQRVRTARNRNLITEEEQRKYYNSTIGIGGLSVGNSVALALALQGGARRLRLADFDRLALSNLNRIRSGVDNLGLEKVKMTARQIYLLDPYAEIEIFPEGLTEENIELFFDGLDIVIDELDTIPIKLRIREEAKKRSIPVLMGADNGDNAILDIDRYDLDPSLQYFHGRLGNATVKDLTGMDKFMIGKTITKMLGPENITERMQSSLLEMGKTIVSWPQLGGAALLNGIGVAYCARKILNGEPLEVERAVLSLDEKLDPAHHTEQAISRRNSATKKFASMFGL